MSLWTTENQPKVVDDDGKVKIKSSKFAKIVAKKLPEFLKKKDKDKDKSEK